MTDLAYFVPDGADGPFFIPAYLKDDGTYSDETWPASAVLMTAAETDRFWKQSAPVGKSLGVTSGRPAWVEAPPATTAQAREYAESLKAALRKTADGEIVWREDAVNEGVATNGEAALLSEWRIYRIRLMRINTDDAPDIEWPEVPGDVA